MKVNEIKALLQTIEQPNDIPEVILQDERVSVVKLVKQWHAAYQKLLLKKQKHEEMLTFEQQAKQKGYRFIAGIDEVGRGPLAGPVVTACVIMKEDSHLIDVNDSKQLSIAKRDVLYDAIIADALAYSIGIVDEKVIDEINIYEATKVAMQKAIDGMSIQPDYLLIDAMKLDNGLPQDNLIKGDARSYSIACASILAKVTRDRLMVEYDEKYPGYDFAKNAGYGTANHLKGIELYGITPIHRKSFEPIKSLLQK